MTTYEPSQTITLRDYFAAQCLASAYINHPQFGGTTYKDQCRELAESAYMMADAMLKAKEAAL